MVSWGRLTRPGTVWSGSGLRLPRLPRIVLSGIWMSHVRTLEHAGRAHTPRPDARRRPRAPRPPHDEGGTPEGVPPKSRAVGRCYSRLPAADSSTSGVSGTAAGLGTPLKVNLASVPSPSASITTI